jgi:hypothetical protein
MSLTMVSALCDPEGDPDGVSEMVGKSDGEVPHDNVPDGDGVTEPETEVEAEADSDAVPLAELVPLAAPVGDDVCE